MGGSNNNQGENMGERIVLTDAIRWIWRDAAGTVVQMMRDEVAETGRRDVEEWAGEVEAFAVGLVPQTIGGAVWPEGEVLSALNGSSRLRTAILQGMAAAYPGVREEALGGGAWTRGFIEEQEWRLDRNLKPNDEYFVFEAYQLLMSVVEPAGPAGGDGAASGRGRGRKTKLADDVFKIEIFPALDEEFPMGGKNEGIIARCSEIGARYDVSGSTIKRKFYDTQGGNKSG